MGLISECPLAENSALWGRVSTPPEAVPSLMAAQNWCAVSGLQCAKTHLDIHPCPTRCMRGPHVKRASVACRPTFACEKMACRQPFAAHAVAEKSQTSRVRGAPAVWCSLCLVARRMHGARDLVSPLRGYGQANECLVFKHHCISIFGP